MGAEGGSPNPRNIRNKSSHGPVSQIRSRTCFNTPPLCGGRPLICDGRCFSQRLQSAASHAEADLFWRGIISNCCLLQSAASVRRQTRLPEGLCWISLVTIRCLRAEADKTVGAIPSTSASYNPLPPCGGRLQKSIIFSPNYHFLHCEIKLFYSLSPFP